MELHGDCFDRMLQIIAREDTGQATIVRLADDQLIGGLLLLYGLHPLDFATRVKSALEKVRPYLRNNSMPRESTAASSDRSPFIWLFRICC